jgi:shikimate kinase
MPPRLVLIGYRASGKTTVAGILAARTMWPAIDADRVLENETGRSIAQIFANDGEAVFRDHEQADLARLLAAPGPWILATGGGCVERAANRAALAAAGDAGVIIAWLAAPAAVLVARLARHNGGRPSLTGGDPAMEATEMLARREPHYRALAHLILDANAGAAENAALLARHFGAEQAHG